MTSRNLTPRPTPEDRREAVYAELVARKDRLSNFFEDFDKLVAPYMSHDQKALKSRADWLDWLRQIFA
jgi:hypothetical protein